MWVCLLVMLAASVVGALLIGGIVGALIGVAVVAFSIAEEVIRHTRRKRAPPVES